MMSKKEEEKTIENKEEKEEKTKEIKEEKDNKEQKKEENQHDVRHEENEQNQENPENNAEKQPNQPKVDQDKFVLIRKEVRTPENLSIRYDLSPLDNIVEFSNEQEKSDLTSLSKNVLLCCNNSYNNYCLRKGNTFFNDLIRSNIVYFLFLGRIIGWLYESKKDKGLKEAPAFWKRFLLMNIPEIIVLYFFRYRKFQKTRPLIQSLFIYLSEKFLYKFNSNMNYNYLAKMNNESYDINVRKKNAVQKKDKKSELYINSIPYLSKETFYEGVIAYANGCFGDFDYDNLTKKEEEIIADTFTFINEGEKKCKEENRIIGMLASLIHSLFCGSSNRFDVKTALFYKLIHFILEDLFIENYQKKNTRKEMLKENKKKYNKEIVSEGYYIEVTEDVILLFKIKEKYRNFEESYIFLCDESEKILKDYKLL